MAKAKVCTVKVSDEGVLSFAFTEGPTREINVHELDENIQRQLMYHGARQKLADSYAGCGGSVPAAVESFDGVLASLESGEWTQRREGGSPQVSQLVEAAMAVLGLERDDAQSKIAELDDEGRKTFRAHPKIKAELARIAAERAAARREAAEKEAANADNPTL